MQLARVILERMTREIRQAVASLPGYGPGITGYKDRDVGSVLAVNTLTVPDRKLSEVRGIRDAQLPGQFDLQRISYYIAWDYENVDTNGDPRALGLVRKVERTYLRDVPRRRRKSWMPRPKRSWPPSGSCMPRRSSSWRSFISTGHRGGRNGN